MFYSGISFPISNNKNIPSSISLFFYNYTMLPFFLFCLKTFGFIYFLQKRVIPLVYSLQVTENLELFYTAAHVTCTHLNSFKLYNTYQSN